MRMTKHQSIELLSRLTGLMPELREKIRAKHTKPGKELSDRERYELLKSGLIKVAKGITEVDENDRIRNVFDFSKYEWCEHLNEPAFEIEWAGIMATNRAARNAITLGDVEGALKIIIGLEKGLS